MQNGTNALRGAGLALLAMGIYATHDVVVKVLGATYSPLQIVFFATVFGFPLVTTALLFDRAEQSLLPRRRWWLLVRSFCMVACGITAFYAFSVLPLAQTYAILFSTPLLVTVIAIPVLGETVRLRRWLAVIAGLTGVLIVLRPGQAELGLGHLAALVSAITAATAVVIVRKIGGGERLAVMLLYPLSGNLLMTGVALPFVYQPMPMWDLALTGVIAVFGLVASFLVILAYRAAEAVVVAPMQYSQMLWAIGYGWFLFGEAVDAPTMVGAGIIIASGLYIVVREGRSPASRHRPVLQAAPGRRA